MLVTASLKIRILKNYNKHLKIKKLLFVRKITVIVIQKKSPSIDEDFAETILSRIPGA